MVSPVVEKLRHAALLSSEDEAALEAALADVRQLPARYDLIREGERPEELHVILEGFACRYKLLPDGGRQIMAWLVPGDFCDLQVAILGEMDHNIGTLSESAVAYVPQAHVRALTEQSPGLLRALWWATLVDESVLREWLVSMGRRPADKQIAHMLCELLLRLKSVGRASDDTVELPLTQAELADTVGLSTVHVNRVIQQLRDEGLITWRGKALAILDLERLQAFADFDPNYLHLVPRLNRRAALGGGSLSADAR